MGKRNRSRRNNQFSNSQTLAALKRDAQISEGLTPIDDAEEQVVAEFDRLEPFQQQMLKHRINQRY